LSKQDGTVRLDQLAERTGLAPRQVRYLISENIVPAAGGTRANPIYDSSHVNAIERYKDFRARGHMPSQIKMLLHVESIVAAGGPIPLGKGLSLIVDHTLLDIEATDPRAVGDTVEAVITTIIANAKEKANAA
jgi:DNA-binding transcriptional MerR regulator